jgi:hypothetical protein
MNGINLFFIFFPESLLINSTTFKLATYLEEALGNTKCHHQDSGIPNTGFMLVLLDRGSRTNERDQSMFYNLSGEFAHKLHYFELATYLEEALGNTKYHHQDSGIPKTVFIPVLLDRGSRTTGGDSFIFYKLSGEFAHKLHYFEVGRLPRSGIRKHEISSPGQWHSKHRIHVGPLG